MFSALHLGDIKRLSATFVLGEDPAWSHLSACPHAALLVLKIRGGAVRGGAGSSKGPGETGRARGMMPASVLQEDSLGPDSASLGGVASGVGGTVSPRKIPRGPNPQYLRMGPSWKQSPCRCKTRSSWGGGGTLTQGNCCPDKERREAHLEKHQVRTQDTRRKRVRQAEAG